MMPTASMRRKDSGSDIGTTGDLLHVGFGFVAEYGAPDSPRFSPQLRAFAAFPAVRFPGTATADDPLPAIR